MEVTIYAHISGLMASSFIVEKIAFVNGQLFSWDL